MSWSSANSNQANGWRSSRPLLGTIVSIWATDQAEPGDASDHALLCRAVELAFAQIEQVHHAMSFHDPQSELSAINRLASQQPVRLSPAMQRVIRASLALSKASSGAFDPCVAVDLVRWGQLPAPAAEPAEAKASWRDIQLSRGGEIHFRRPLWLDLGGIAKGYAVDLAINSLRHSGIRAATVNAGGDLRSFGHEHTVSVRDPAQPSRQIPLLQARNLAVATSAGYFSLQRGRTALVNPRTRRSGAQKGSVTVCAQRALWADALTKVVLFADEPCATTLLRRLGASAMRLDRSGQRREVA